MIPIDRLRRPAASALAAALALSAMASAGAETPPQKQTIEITVFGNDPCPQSDDPEEIVVCARLPEGDRFRIPKRFRDEKPEDAPAEMAWGSRVDTMNTLTRFTRPNSCSVVGSGGQTGCTAAMLSQWFAERRAMKAAENEGKVP
ncbi:MAG: hypothetical protein ACO1O3_09025 [Sphingobium sp.]